jgi:hypothetical protein
MRKSELKEIIKQYLFDVIQERCWKNYEPVPGKKPYSKGSCRKKEELLEAMNTCLWFDSKQEAIQYLKKNPLSCVGWGDTQAIYWNGKVRLVKSDKKYDLTKMEEASGKCLKRNTQKSSSDRKDKKWTKCTNGKRIHWGDPNAKVTGKSGNTKRKKSFRARHNCSSAKPGTPRHAACQDWNIII